VFTPRRARLTYLIAGIALVAAGIFMLGSGVINHLEANAQANQRGSVDHSALNAWNSGGKNDLRGAVQEDAPSTTGTCSPGGAPASQYALVEFTGLPQYNYAGVAGDGTWDLLHQRSMVHYTGTPAPGQPGNSIIAFHREPDFQYIDQLGTGGTVTIQDRQCNVYVYTVTNSWTLNPNSVTQLVPTSGYQLTLITCTPFWQDFDRIVWRASLTSVNGKPFTA
jgi:LPXTG-site transpeptidase (sortase) family protein